MSTITTGSGQTWGVKSVSGDYTTDGESHIYVDTSSGAVTVTLASADAVSGREINILDVGDNAATNNITVNTEGAATIDPGGVSSKTIDSDGGSLQLFSDGTDWVSVVGSGGGGYTDEQAQDAIGAMVDATLTYTDATPELAVALATIAGTNLTVSGDTINALSDEEIQDVAGGLAGTNLTYDDGGNAINALSDEEIQDIVGGMAGTNLTYDDAGNVINASSGSGGFTQSTKTADYTASDGDSVWADSSSAAVTVTLPTPAASAVVRVTNVDDTNGVDIAPSSTESINGSASNFAVNGVNTTVTVESDGTNWRTV